MTPSAWTLRLAVLPRAQHWALRATIAPAAGTEDALEAIDEAAARFCWRLEVTTGEATAWSGSDSALAQQPAVEDLPAAPDSLVAQAPGRCRVRLTYGSPADEPTARAWSIDVPFQEPGMVQWQLSDAPLPEDGPWGEVAAQASAPPEFIALPDAAELDRLAPLPDVGLLVNEGPGKGLAIRRSSGHVMQLGLPSPTAVHTSRAHLALAHGRLALGIGEPSEPPCIVLIDTRAGHVLGRARPPWVPTLSTFTPSGHWFLSFSDGTLALWDRDRESWRASIGAPVRALSVAADRLTAVSAEEIVVLDPQGRIRSRHGLSTAIPWDAAVAAGDGAAAWAAPLGCAAPEGAVCIERAGQAQRWQVVPDDLSDARLVWTAAGSLVVMGRRGHALRAGASTLSFLGPAPRPLSCIAAEERGNVLVVWTTQGTIVVA